MGNYFIRDMTDVATNAGSGFVEYYWNNPATGLNEKKLSYINTIPGIEYFIGSGFYIRSTTSEITIVESNRQILKNVNLSFAEGIKAVFNDIYSDSTDRVEFCRTMLDPIKFFDDNSGYFFVVDLSGNVVSHGESTSLEGQNVYDFQDVNGAYFIRDMIEVAENPGYGFTEYYWNNPNTGKDQKKMAYVIRIQGTDYFIGSGVYI
jgi:signal transduction histidine kinase